MSQKPSLIWVNSHEFERSNPYGFSFSKTSLAMPLSLENQMPFLTSRCAMNMWIRNWSSVLKIVALESNQNSEIAFLLFSKDCTNGKLSKVQVSAWPFVIKLCNGSMAEYGWSRNWGKGLLSFVRCRFDWRIG